MTAWLFPLVAALASSSLAGCGSSAPTGPHELDPRGDVCTELERTVRAMARHAPVQRARFRRDGADARCVADWNVAAGPCQVSVHASTEDAIARAEARKPALDAARGRLERHGAIVLGCAEPPGPASGIAELEAWLLPFAVDGPYVNAFAPRNLTAPMPIELGAPRARTRARLGPFTASASPSQDGTDVDVFPYAGFVVGYLDDHVAVVELRAGARYQRPARLFGVGLGDTLDDVRVALRDEDELTATHGRWYLEFLEITVELSSDDGTPSPPSSPREPRTVLAVSVRLAP